MAKADLSKMKKGELADFLAKKLSKDDLTTIAEHVQNGTFNAEMLRGVSAPDQGVPAQPEGVVETVVSEEGVTPQDTTANLGTSGVDY